VDEPGVDEPDIVVSRFLLERRTDCSALPLYGISLVVERLCAPNSADKLLDYRWSEGVGMLKELGDGSRELMVRSR
jgi:hypothetical protein